MAKKALVKKNVGDEEYDVGSRVIVHSLVEGKCRQVGKEGILLLGKV